VPHVKTGKLRAIAVTSLKRAKSLPDVPTVAESGVRGFEVENWQGIVVQSRTPKAIVDRLHDAIAKVLAMPAMVDVLAAQGLDPAPSTPAQFDKLIRTEIERWTKLVKTAGIRIE
jgi:tripartite-type tricarboxylate transporter receptor subunit TctC